MMNAPLEMRTTNPGPEYTLSVHTHTAKDAEQEAETIPTLISIVGKKAKVHERVSNGK